MTAIRLLLGNIRRRLRLLGRTDAKAEVLRHFDLLRRPKHKPGSIIWHGTPLRYADGPALYYQLGDIYVARCYDFHQADRRPRILDVGGHIGLASLRFREQFPDADITVFEPDPALVSLIRANLAAIQDPHTVVIEAAAWMHDGEIGFQHTGDDSGSIRQNSLVKVNCVDLAAHCATPVDYLKLDIEGAEFAVLEHLHRTGALAQVRRLFVELHAWDYGQPPSFHLVFQILAAAGFDYRIRSAEVFPSQHAADIDPARTANLVTLFAWRPEPQSC